MSLFFPAARLTRRLPGFFVCYFGAFLSQTDDPSVTPPDDARRFGVTRWQNFDITDHNGRGASLGAPPPPNILDRVPPAERRPLFEGGRPPSLGISAATLRRLIKAGIGRGSLKSPSVVGRY